MADVLSKESKLGHVDEVAEDTKQNLAEAQKADVGKVGKAKQKLQKLKARFTRKDQVKQFLLFTVITE